jgi:hypothetical protein
MCIGSQLSSSPLAKLVTITNKIILYQHKWILILQRHVYIARWHESWHLATRRSLNRRMMQYRHLAVHVLKSFMFAGPKINWNKHPKDGTTTILAIWFFEPFRVTHKNTWKITDINYIRWITGSPIFHA